MKKTSIFLILFIIVIAKNVFAQDCKENIFISITKQIVSLKEFDTILFDYDYKGKKSLFVQNISEYFTDFDKAIEESYNDKVIYFWFMKHLFFYNIEYWLEYTKFEIKDKNIFIEFKTMNSVNSEVQRKRIKGNIVLSKKDKTWLIKSVDFKYL